MNIRRAAVAAAAFLVTIPLYAYRISTWIPPWDSSALTSVQEFGKHVQESNPVWYSMNASGTIVANWRAEDPTWRSAMTGSALLPTVQNVVSGKYDGNVVASLLATSASRTAHADALVALVLSKGYDGIDVDYERVPYTSRDAFTDFIRILGAKLHASDRKLSVSVYAKTDGSTTRNGPGAQDWPALAQHADSIKIMAYDYHWSGSEAGAITPLDWLDRIATYAENSIPAAKIAIALPFFGHDWVGTSGTDVVWEQAIALAKSKGATVTHDANGEATFAYADHVVYFQDATSYRSKLDMLRKKHPAITSFAHWRVGKEDPAIWDYIASIQPAAPKKRQKTVTR